MTMYEQYEDGERLGKSSHRTPMYSPFQDFRLYESSITPGVLLGLNIIKPERPGYMLVQLHGWHMSMPTPQVRDTPSESSYVIVQVDMRGRAFSDGLADCNGYELIDIYDAVQFVRKEYADCLLAPDPVYLEGGSGGGGNVLATVAKFPDLFAAATALYGISDYALWYKQDEIGEFRDDMDIWIGCTPERDEERYEARSGFWLAANVRTPLYIAHGDGDIRVPVEHSRIYVKEMERLGKQSLIHYDELLGVGAGGHLTHITEAQSQQIVEGSERNRKNHPTAPTFPSSGKLIAGGYVYTSAFQVHLESVDALASLTYDLLSRRISLEATCPYRYQIKWADGEMEEGQCTINKQESK
jgi:pimeloyl-ACP methyl ester carboxylesterase